MAEKRYPMGIIGGLRRDYYITAEGTTYLGIPGGHGLYAAVGARVWCDEVALFSRMGPGIPESDLAHIRVAGIRMMAPSREFEALELRRFFAYVTREHRLGSNPAAHFLRIGPPLPKDLLGYPAPDTEQATRVLGGLDSFLPDDLLADSLSAGCFHLCPA